MARQNRVTPWGEIIATPERGTCLGNRGVLHDEQGRIRRPWQVRRWLLCRLEFNGRRRVVMAPNRYTELFFLDEATGLAAGHRPCFECRRADAVAFAAAWARAQRLNAPPQAPDMDVVLQEKRLVGREKRRHRAALDALPDGAMIVLENDAPLAVRGDALLPWSFSGYAAARPRPRGIEVELLTPPAIVAALSAGYRPQWHPSAG